MCRHSYTRPLRIFYSSRKNYENRHIVNKKTVKRGEWVQEKSPTNGSRGGEGGRGLTHHKLPLYCKCATLYTVQCSFTMFAKAPWYLYKMVAKDTLRTCGLNQTML